MVFSDFQHARATLCGDRRGRGAKPMVFSDFQHARATFCGDRRGRGAKTHGVFRFLRCLRNPLRGSACSRCKNPCFFLRFLRCPRNPLRGSAWSRCKNLEVFCDFCGARATLCGDRRGRGAKTHVFFCDFCCSNWSSGVVSWFARLLPEPAGPGFDSSLVRGRASQDATCILKQLAQSNLRRATCAEQVAQSNLRRPTCTDQFAQSALPRATCAEQLTQSNLRRATCTEQLAQSNLQRAQFAQSNLQGATCRHQLAGATCAEQLAQSNLHSATCVEQLAQTNLHRPVCAEHLAWCCLALASQMLRVGMQRWADLACDVLLSGQPWSSSFYSGGTRPGIPLSRGRHQSAIAILWHLPISSSGGHLQRLEPLQHAARRLGHSSLQAQIHRKGKVLFPSHWS